jgi:class 3 adenylate cyclase/predicted ATPase
VTDDAKQPQLEQLRASLHVLEVQRDLLGDVIEPALEAIRRQILSLETELLAEALVQDEERHIVTVLFTDIVGSTTLAEKIDPEDWRTIVNRVHGVAGNAVQKHGGLIIQYQGDGIIALFGLPAPSERDPENAVRAALDMQTALAQLDIQPRIRMRVGVHTGLIVTGFIGSDVKREFSAFGDAVNLAARLQAAAPVDGVIISHDTYRYVRGVFDLAPQAPMLLKGKTEPVQTYVVQRARPRPFRTVTRGVAGIETQTIGRETELKKLLAAYQTASAERHLSWAHISGEPGMGKSRLLSDARDALDLLPERFRWLRGRAFQGDEKHAFMLIRRIWFDRFQITEDAPRAEAEARWLGQFALLRGPGHEADAYALGLLAGLQFRDSPHLTALRADPVQLKGRAYVVSRELLAAMRRDLPIVMLLEDLHWADPSSLDYLLRLLLEDSADDQRSVVVISTARAEWSIPPALLKYHAYLPILLTPLPAAACRELVLALLHRVDNVPEHVVQTIVRRSEGVPYYVEEIINWLLDHAIIDASAKPWCFDAERFRAIPLPSTLQHLLLTRLSTLTDAERVTLQRGSIFGRHMWEGGLAALNIPDSHTILSRLQPRGFVDAQPESSLAGEREWSFHHNLLREAAYESLLKRERRSLHRAAAVWLEAQARQAGRLEEFVGILAVHADQAGNASAAADWYLRAGARSQAQGAYLEARASFERILELTPPADHHRRWQAWLGRTDAASQLGDREARRLSVEALLELAQYLGPLQLAEAHYRKALLLDAAGDYAASLDEYQIALISARESRATSLEIRMMGMLLLCQSRLNDFAGAAAIAQQILDRIHELEGTDSIKVLTNVANYYVESGDLARGAQLHQEQAAIAQRLGDRSSQANALVNLGYDYMCLGRYQEGRGALEQSLQLFEEFGARRWLAYARLNLGLIYWRSADWSAALNLLKSARSELAALGDTFAEAAELSYSALVLEQINETREAQQQFETARSIYVQAGTRGNAADALAGLVRCALVLRDLDTVRRCAAELWNYLRLQGTQGMEFPLRAYLTCVEAYTALGESGLARKAIEAGYDELMTRADKISQLEWGRSFLVNVPEHRAIIELWEQIAD